MRRTGARVKRALTPRGAGMPASSVQSSPSTTRSKRFAEAVAFVLLQEAVFAKGHQGNWNFVVSEKVKNDPGGLTKFGIDQRSHPDLDIESLTKDQAEAVYWKSYWLLVNGDKMPLGYGEILFDIRVNGGDGPKMLQQALNGLGEKLVVDGDIGPMTLAAMNKRGVDGIKAFLKRRQAYYDDLAGLEMIDGMPHLTHPKFAGFHAGWTNRNNALKKFVLGLVG